MIQGFTETNINTNLSTEDNRINKTVAFTQIRFLVKLINDLDGSVDYCYPNVTIYNRYTAMEFIYLSTPDSFTGSINLLPAGHWKYEVYEVSWIGSVVVALNTAPATEIEVLPVDDNNGVVQGIVTKGILNLTEKAGTEQVQYNQHETAEGTNYIYYGVAPPGPPPPPFANLYSLSFDGIDDYLTFGDVDVFTPNNSGANRGFSMSYWLKLASGGQRVIGKTNIFSGGQRFYEYQMLVNSSGKLILNFFSGGVNTIYIGLQIDISSSYNTWQNIIVSWDLGVSSNDIIIYIDGVKYSIAEGNATASASGVFTAVDNTINPLEIAQIGNNNGEIFFDEFAIFDDALTQEQATTIYNSGVPTDLSDMAYLLGYWRNGDTAGPSVYPTIEDYSANSNDGTMTNMDSGDIVTDVP